MTEEQSGDEPPETLLSYLRALRLAAGEPSLREMARYVSASHTTLGDLFRPTNGRAVQWVHIFEIVRHLRGDTKKARKLWSEQRVELLELSPLQTSEARFLGKRNQELQERIEGLEEAVEKITSILMEIGGAREAEGDAGRRASGDAP